MQTIEIIGIYILIGVFVTVTGLAVSFYKMNDPKIMASRDNVIDDPMHLVLVWILWGMLWPITLFLWAIISLCRAVLLLTIKFDKRK